LRGAEMQPGRQCRQILKSVPTKKERSERKKTKVGVKRHDGLKDETQKENNLGCNGTKKREDTEPEETTQRVGKKEEYWR